MWRESGHTGQSCWPPARRRVCRREQKARAGLLPIPWWQVTLSPAPASPRAIAVTQFYEWLSRLRERGRRRKQGSSETLGGAEGSWRKERALLMGKIWKDEAGLRRGNGRQRGGVGASSAERRLRLCFPIPLVLSRFRTLRSCSPDHLEMVALRPVLEAVGMYRGSARYWTHLRMDPCHSV